ncbi:MAG TPA: tripartite tricarboxylate transporter substrate binding protein [Xanthobacteraceae bacterium]|jgi:tripartite-type tricarboxylate transporter receptor subunit TctC|nr:tripartite tricarboxylate transporter substrate binding protein [Xanthobacteraceae bacterium]
MLLAWPKSFGVALGLMLLACGFTQAQDYPSKPIKIIVPTAAGGIADQIARVVSQHLTDSAMQAVVVENRTGAGGAIAADAVAKSPNDGYTVLLGQNATNAILPLLNPKLGYDPVKDFTPVIHIAAFPNLLVVNAKVPVTTVTELLRHINKNPGRVSYASQGNGSSGHMMGEQFRLVTKADIVHVPYRGAAPAVQDLVGGQVQMMFDALVLQAPQLAAGNTRALAITTNQRLAALPDVPTMAEAGFPDLQGGAWFGLFAPAGTPRPAVEWLNAEVKKAFSSAAVRERLSKQGAQLMLGSPRDFSDFVDAEMTRWRGVITTANIKITD